MKNKLWLLQIPVVLLFTSAFYITEEGIRGNLHDDFLRTKLFPVLRIVSGAFTNAKFQLRGPTAPQNKVVIVEIDSDAIAQLGRWPWHRDVTGYLIDKTFQAGARVVGLDMVFSEPDRRISDELAKYLQANGLADSIEKFETDYELRNVIKHYKDRLVLGWITDNWCQPAYRKNADDCPVTDPSHIANLPKFFEKFAYSQFNIPFGFDPEKTPLLSAPDIIANIGLYNSVGEHSGSLAAWPDKDGYIRRTNLVMLINGKPYPSLPLEMARVILGEELTLTLDNQHRIQNLGFAHSKRMIPVTPLGAMEINFRGPSNSFQYVRALEVMGDGDNIQIEKVENGGERKIASASKAALLKDAYVMIGLSALGVFDMRAFPFDSNVPGVEGQATILDNLLTGDVLTPGNGKSGSFWLFLLMTVGAFLFAFITEKLESIPGLLLFIAVISGLTFFDLKVLFSNNINWDTSFLVIEMGSIFIFTLVVKYILEEKNKKFIRGAFSKYVAPAIVDSILKDPSKLTVGGEKKELTIMFSDIRGFTSFSERMDAKALAHFLNDYLGIMTDLVFANQGTLDKYIGDAVMAFWGAPLDQNQHAANACKTAVKMIKALTDNQERFKTQYGVDVNIGIGINSGAVNVGNMGSQTIFEYTVIGDHVNLASRLEGLTKPYGVTIVTTRFTFDDIQKCGEPHPAHRVLDFVKVKGKKKAVELIQVLDRDYSQEGLKIFEEARQLYISQKWNEAIEKFNAANLLLRKSPEEEDGPCKMFIERCVDFKAAPPSTEWDGSWEMHSK